MKENRIGEFEEIVLLTVGILYGKAYGIAIKREIEERLNRKVSVGALHTALRRLEGKGFLTAEFGEATQERGGKRKKYFTVTMQGFRALKAVRTTRDQLWDSLPPLAFDFG